MSDVRLQGAFALLSRRAVLGTGLSAAAVTAAVTGAAPVLAQKGPAQVPVDELMKNDLPDIIVGKADAPVTIVEYASLSCNACAAFHTIVYPKLKAKYIDTGKARLVFRDYPLNNIAFAGSMLARCVNEDVAPDFISELFKRQEAWAFGSGPAAPRLFEVVRQMGFTQASFDKCLTDTKLLEQLEASRKRAADKFGVNATPTFFVNGKRMAGVSLADFEKAIDPLLKS